MTLRAALVAQGNSKGKAWRKGQCLALLNFPVLTRAAFADLLANWEYRAGTVSPPDIQSPACNQLRKQGFFVRQTQAGKRYPPLYSQYFDLGL